MEPFTLIEESSAPGAHHLFDDVLAHTSAPTADHDLQYIARLREANPGMIVTAKPANNLSARTGSTNFLDRLDPGLSKRRSRFDRKYLFPQPNEREKTLYCEHWRHKLEKKPDVEFPRKLSPVMAHITSSFSFAFLQECFVATPLTLARGETGSAEKDDDEDLDRYELWRTFKQQADALRKEIDDETVFESSMHSRWSDKVTLAGNSKTPVATSSTLITQNPPHSATNSPKGTPLPDLRGLAVRDELLPQLPYAYQKRAFINSAAIEERLP
ncbi:hypothetical protein KC345_g8039 [Hortaea werneckii]|nr:hypothetical protein KC345_g8039 [Hortaea werneckii]